MTNSNRLKPQCFVVMIILLLCSVGCVTDGSGWSGTSVRQTGGSINLPSNPTELSTPKVAYTGPKVRVAVMSFDDKTGQTTTISSRGGATVVESNPIGSGMADQLTTALMQTGVFTVIERQFIADVQLEQSLTGGETALAKPDYFIYGAVTEYQFSQSDASLGAGFNAIGGGAGIGGGLAVLAGQAIMAMSKKDHIAVDLRVVDASTSEIVATTSLEGSASDFGAAAGGMFGNTLIAGSGSYRTPPAKAVRACCVAAANWFGEQMSLRQQVERATAAAVN